MDKRELRNLVADMIKSENELYDFAVECIKHIFGKEHCCALGEFEQIYDSLDEGYGLSLECLIQNENLRLENIKAYKEKSAKEKQ